MILNDITKDKNKVLDDESNKHVKLHNLEKRMEEAVSTFKSVDEADKWNGGPHQYNPLIENENLTRRSNK